MNLKSIFKKKSSNFHNPPEALQVSDYGHQRFDEVGLLEDDDDLRQYLLDTQGTVEIDKLKFDSPAVRELRKAGVVITVPLIHNNEILRLLNLGPRKGGLEYTAQDIKLLDLLSSQVASVSQVIRLIEQQKIAAVEQERISRELEIARVIQQKLIPQETLELEGWRLSAHYQPARVVGGDFYDFLLLPDGKLFLTIGDVVDKGIPAALIMANIRSILRGTARGLYTPDRALNWANEIMCIELPRSMFITCAYALLDPSSGELTYANAGHNPLFVRKSEGVEELFTQGFPLGIMPDAEYEHKSIRIEPGEFIVFYSDGLTEAHNAEMDMFGHERVLSLLEQETDFERLNEHLINELETFTGTDHTQEDDITILSLYRQPV